MSIKDRMFKVVSDQLGVDIRQITEESSFVDDLDADSLDVVEMGMAIEEEFDIQIPDEEAEKIGTVGQAIKYINKHPKYN